MFPAQGFRPARIEDQKSDHSRPFAQAFDCSSQAIELPKHLHFNKGQNPALRSLPATSNHSEVHQSQEGKISYFTALSYLPQVFLLFAPSFLGTLTT